MSPRNAVLPLLLLAGACGYGSLAAPFPESDRSFDTRLLGTWQNTSTNESFAVKSDGAGGYLIDFTDEKGKTGRFHGWLGRIGTYDALDILPDKASIPGNDSYKDLMLPLHAVLFVDSVGTEIRFRTVLVDSLNHLLLREPATIAHVRMDAGVVLTAPTAELQKFLTTFTRRPGVLSEPIVVVKR